MEDCYQRFVVAPLGSSVIQKAKELLQTYGHTKALRTLDALHLGACLSALPRGELVFVSADARQFGYRCVRGPAGPEPRDSCGKAPIVVCPEHYRWCVSANRKLNRHICAGGDGGDRLSVPA